ncbi:hypothetical protein ACFPOU_03595 [Massilia jejuensis]|uniref:MSHA biogenesis protein MshK n=1 Tax=Massilia jejuensis TaxID=648894 RepID=A0ABW0PCP8_9BURK
MDEAVKRSLACLLLACAGAAGAQALHDPTRPPASLAAPQAGAGAAAAGPAAQPAPRLQSVLVGRQPGGRSVAVIDGETLRVGELYKGARVTRIGQDEVELRRGGARQVLKLNAAAALGHGIERIPNQ